MLQRLQDIGGKKSMNRIYKAFENKKAFIGFLTAGDPVIDKTVDYILDMEQAGASLIEIGIPFSDPIAEGPTIQEANVRALKNKVTTDDVFEMVKKVREKSDIPLCFMTYLNVVFHYGYDEFFKKCQEVGIDGIILPDLPYEESQEVKDVCYNYDVTLISMIAPTSKDRVEMIAKEAKGFVYCVSSLGVTGVRSEIKTDVAKMVEMVKEVNDIPAAIGFGISTPEQAKKMASVSDGAIVGSAIVKIVAKYGKECIPEVEKYVKEMKAAVEI